MPPRPPPPESRWTLEDGAKEWMRNRGGGGCWPKAPRDSGTLALIEEKRLDLARRAPAPKTTWSPPSWPPPAWSRMQRRAGHEGERRGAPAYDKASEYASNLTRAELWPMLDASAMHYTALEDLLVLLVDASPLVDAGRTLPGRVKPAGSDGVGDHADSQAAAAAAEDATAERRAELNALAQAKLDATGEGLATALAGAFNGELRERASASGAAAAETDLAEGLMESSARLGDGMPFQTLGVHLSHNQFGGIAELPRVLSLLVADVSRLITLDLSSNRIEHIAPSIKTLASLEVLRLHNNRIARMDELVHLKPLQHLSRLSLMHNPLVMQRLSTLALLHLKQTAPTADASHQYEHNPMVYRLRVVARLPRLRQLDQMPVTEKERSRAKTFGATVRKGDGELRSRPHPHDIAALARLHRKEEASES